MLDLWSIHPGNMILESDDVIYVRRIVGEMLDLGWSANELSLGLPDDRVLDGDELIAWLGES